MMIVRNFFQAIGGIFRGLFQRTQPAASDTGLFDPYLPINSLKEVASEYDSPFTDQEEQLFSDQSVSKRSFLLLKIFLFVVAFVLCMRLVYLQISQGQENYSLAEGNRLRTELLEAPRGLIYDRNGVPLVKNVPSFAVVFHSSDWPKKAEAQQEVVERIGTVLNQPADQIRSTIKQGLKDDVVTLQDNLTRDQALAYQLELNEVPGTEVDTSPIREYTDLPGLGHLAGYIGKVTKDDLANRPELESTSLIGKAGLEKTYDETLQGKPGIETLEVDSLGRTVRSVGNQPAQVGRSLLLGLDSALQTQAASSLQDSIQKNHATSGAAVVMDVRTGDILAMVSFPLYDNNLFSSSANQQQRQQVLNDPLSPLINRAVSGLYPSGSTIKPVVASAALQEKVITPATKIDTSAGKIVIGQTTFVDWKVHGIADVKQAIAESNNIFFYTVGGGHDNIAGLGVDRLAKYYQKFGLGQKTGIDLPGEQAGLVPTPDWKKKTKGESWFIGDTYNMSIGQGDLLLTPLQLTRAIAAIANGGKLLQPRMVKSVLGTTNDPAKDISPVVANSQVADPDVLETVREGMRQTVLAGSARSFQDLGVEVAAKTGTAQFSVIEKDKTHSWFTAFAPYQDPQIAVSVIVEGGGEGYSVAAPVAKNIIENYFHLPLTPIVPATPDN